MRDDLRDFSSKSVEVTRHIIRRRDRFQMYVSANALGETQVTVKKYISAREARGNVAHLWRQQKRRR